jgi:hypothetical protein
MSVRKLPHKPDEPGVTPPAGPDEAGAGHTGDESLEPRPLPRVAADLKDDAVVLVCLSGRGDKDMGTVAKALGVELSR